MEMVNEDYVAADVRLQTAIEAQDLTLFSMLKPTIQQDGTQWCVLYGDDLQVGIAGFGSSPHRAVLDFNRSWYEDIETKQ